MFGHRLGFLPAGWDKMSPYLFFFFSSFFFSFLPSNPDFKNILFLPCRHTLPIPYFANKARIPHFANKRIDKTWIFPLLAKYDIGKMCRSLFFFFTNPPLFPPLYSFSFFILFFFHIFLSSSNEKKKKITSSPFLPFSLF
ncbi:unnamed protein product [Meloidogyne enterolobii]|uniref:Uncharacterized protein n=1 Tax=Meloidogyne enterolobii TaxID=390850 RepID=A0ACB1AQ73_MELEN